MRFWCQFLVSDSGVFFLFVFFLLLDYLFSKFPFLVLWNCLALCKTRYFGPSFDQSHSHQVQLLGHHSKQSKLKAGIGQEVEAKWEGGAAEHTTMWVGWEILAFGSTVTIQMGNCGGLDDTGVSYTFSQWGAQVKFYFPFGEIIP